MEWWWGTFCSWFNVGFRLHVHGDGLPDGGGYTQPEHRLYQRCCRCGKFRILGRFVEMYARGDEGSWWYSCVECALADMTKIVEGRGSR